MPPSVAAIVLSYNGRDLTLESLASLTRMTYPDFDLVVVDNGSTDGTREAVGRAFPGVAQVRSEENLGPAGGLNLGIRWALARGYDYLLLLNNDIEADPSLLDELVRVAEADPTIGCVGPKIFYHGERDRLWSAGGVIRFKDVVVKTEDIVGGEGKGLRVALTTLNTGRLSIPAACTGSAKA
ncbi:MAG: glycosyltransferase, partial [Myxococcales bacterium]|nr:glycosyltransferase [Myxococcales bacterium]